MPRMIARSWLCIGDLRSFTRSSPAPGSGIGASPRWTTSVGSPNELIRTARMHFPLQIEAGDPADYRLTVAGLTTSWRMVAPPETVLSGSCAELVQAPEKTRGERLGPF